MPALLTAPELKIHKYAAVEFVRNLLVLIGYLALFCALVVVFSFVMAAILIPYRGSEQGFGDQLMELIVATFPLVVSTCGAALSVFYLAGLIKLATDIQENTQRTAFFTELAHLQKRNP